MNMHEQRLQVAVEQDAQRALDRECQQLVREEHLDQARAAERGRLAVKRELRRQGVPDTALWARLPRTRVPEPAPAPMHPVLLIFVAVSVAAWCFGAMVGGLFLEIGHTFRHALRF